MLSGVEIGKSSVVGCFQLFSEIKMDSQISEWILEFLLRQPIPDHIIHTLLTKLPISHNNPILKRSFLLKSLRSTINNATFSDQILQLLEAVESIEKEEGKVVPESMKKAYCAAALECVVKEAGDRGKYMEAVERVWRERIGRLEERGSLLMTEELGKWRDEVEAALWDDALRRKLLGRKKDAAALVGEYLEEAIAALGDPFLQLVAKMETEEGGGRRGGGMLEDSEDLASSLGAGTKRGEERGPENDNGEDMEVELAANMRTEVKERGPEINSGGEVDEAKEKERESHCGEDVQGVLKKKKHAVRFKHVATGYRRSKGRVRISEDDHIESASRKYDTLPSPEVEKVQEALKTSSMELKALVKDPLPDALQFAATLTTESEREVLQLNISVGNQHEKVQEGSNAGVEKNGKEVNAPNPLVKEAVEPRQAVESSGVIPSSSHQNNVSKPSLMERNNTARTYEWDDFSDGSPGETSNHRTIHLHSTKRKLVSPLKKYETTKFTKRRQLKKWSLEEEDALRDGVQKFGRGNWKLILNSKRDIFVERTEVDLKDKWRNMTK